MEDSALTYDVLKPSQWERMTRSPRKVELFEEDLYFRECWADTTDVLGDSSLELLERTALLSFKADGVVGRRVSDTLSFLQENGFRVSGVAPIRQNRHSIRELWRYNWHVYTTDRLALMTVMHTANESMLLLLRDTEYDGVVPASVRIADLKGSANPAARLPGQLRTRLEPPNPVINFVHVADEPADVVRELGILLDRPRRRRLLASLASGPWNDGREAAEREAARLERTVEAHDFDLEESLSRIAAHPGVAPEGADVLSRSARGGGRLTWEELVGILPPPEPGEPGFWDFVLIGSEVLLPERTGFPDLLPASSAEEWSKGPAR